jgi:hypothetical protein
MGASSVEGPGTHHSAGYKTTERSFEHAVSDHDNEAFVPRDPIYRFPQTRPATYALIIPKKRARYVGSVGTHDFSDPEFSAAGTERFKGRKWEFKNQPATGISRLARTSSYEGVVLCRTSLFLAFVDSTTGVSFKREQDLMIEHPAVSVFLT